MPVEPQIVQPQIARRIFVVGVPRSGTTLVQSLLAAHSTMTSFTESHLLSRHFALLPLFSLPVLTKNPAPRLAEFLAENNEHAPASAAWFEKEGQQLLRSRALLPLRTRSVAEKLLQVFDQLALGRGKSGWIEKTPRHLRYLPLIESLSEGAGSDGAGSGAGSTHFVHVIRRGLEVVASLHAASQSWQHPYGVEACVRRWNADLRFSLKRMLASGGRAREHCVFYERLTQKPEAVLRELLGELGLDWEPELLERHAQMAGQLVTPQEVWKEGVGRKIKRSATSHRALTARQRKQASQGLQHGLYDQLLERAPWPSVGATTGAAP